MKTDLGLLSKGIFTADFIPESADLNEFVSFIKEQPAEPIEDRVETVSRSSSAGDTEQSMPLTLEEAAAVDARINQLLRELKTTKERIGGTRKQIHAQVMDIEGSGNQLSFSFDVKKRPRLKRLLKKVFGERVDAFTYEMYLECIETRRLLEQQQSDEYLHGEAE